jgi:hypothetical protein
LGVSCFLTFCLSFLAMGGCASSGSQSQAASPSTAPEPAVKIKSSTPAPAKQAPAVLTACSMDIDVLDTGGLALTYTAAPGHEAELRRDVRGVASRHNARLASEPRDDLADLVRVGTVAIVEDAPRGARVILVADDAGHVAELWSNVDLYAPDLVPRAAAESCPKRASRVATRSRRR